MLRWCCRGLPALVGVSLALVFAAAAVGAPAQAPQAHIARTCSVGSGENEGYSYLTWLWTSRRTCTQAKNLAVHHGRLHGWVCKRTVLDRSPVQYDAKEICKSGRAEIEWTGAVWPSRSWST